MKILIVEKIFKQQIFVQQEPYENISTMKKGKLRYILGLFIYGNTHKASLVHVPWPLGRPRIDCITHVYNFKINSYVLVHKFIFNNIHVP